jgi:hypothetical protein
MANSDNKGTDMKLDCVLSPATSMPILQDAARTPPSRRWVIREIKRPRTSAKATSLEDFVGESKVAASRFFSEMCRANLSQASFEPDSSGDLIASGLADDKDVQEPLAEGRPRENSSHTCNLRWRQTDDYDTEDRVAVHTNLCPGHLELNHQTEPKTKLHSCDNTL